MPGGKDRLGQHHPDDLRAFCADRLEQAKLTGAFGNDGREQYTH